MNKKRNKLLTVIIALSFSTVLFVTTVSAYTFLGPKLNNPRYTTFQIITGTPAHITLGWTRGASSWNNAQSKVRFTKSTSSVHKLGSINSSQRSLFGRITYSHKNGLMTKSHGQLNVKANYNNQDMKNPKVARSTAAHELGHLMGLNHSSKTSVMNSNRDRRVIFSPKADDISGINFRYSY